MTEAAEAGAVNPKYAEARFRPGTAPGIVTETFPDGSSCTSSVGRRGRIETPPVEIKPRTFNPLAVDIYTYMDLRRWGFVPEVRVTEKPRDSLSQSADIDAWREYRARGEVPEC